MADVTGASGFDSPRLRDILNKTKPWARLLSVLYYIASGFMIVIGVIAAVGMSVMSAARPGGPPVWIVGLIYPLLGAFNLIPATLLGRFASRAGEYATSGSGDDLERAMDAQRSYWKFMGILALIGIGCFILALGAGVLTGVWMARQAR